VRVGANGADIGQRADEPVPGAGRVGVLAAPVEVEIIAVRRAAIEAVAVGAVVLGAPVSERGLVGAVCTAPAVVLHVEVTVKVDAPVAAIGIPARVGVVVAMVSAGVRAVRCPVAARVARLTRIGAGLWCAGPLRVSPATVRPSRGMAPALARRSRSVRVAPQAVAGDRGAGVGTHARGGAKPGPARSPRIGVA